MSPLLLSSLMHRKGRVQAVLSSVQCHHPATNLPVSQPPTCCQMPLQCVLSPEQSLC